MFKKIAMMTVLLICLTGGILFAGSQDNRLNELIDQLNGKSCKYELQGYTCVNRKLFASFLRRNDKERCVIDAANLLGMMGEQAQGAVPALIEALNKYRNIDSGDGIIPVRSKIALALGMIGDLSAIKPLIAVLVSDDPVKLSASASVPAGYKLIQGTSYGAAAEALGMFGPQAKEALPVLNGLIAKGQDDLRIYTLVEIEEAIKKIEQ